jgi:large subunit ribosomal protein L30
MLAIIRIRGLKHIRHDIKHAFEDLRLDRKNHLVLIAKTGKEIDGMLFKVKDFVAYGNVNATTVAELIEKRGRMEGDKRLTLEHLKAKKMASFKDAATALIEGKHSLQDLGIKPVFRLNSPKKGFARVGIKKPVSMKGDLGYHKEGVDALVAQMM